ncbi:calmodulin-1 [Anaeramoeba flamelloides]|uniref:Calmodulin-1 n=1 Tax=Anaeramoeba flamelloides TaxID=1746091 RepID=A0ABQ8Z7S9_9EUKA|nr:calmodulin-1 [Anaeramoeba flamelloides]
MLIVFLEYTKVFIFSNFLPKFFKIKMTEYDQNQISEISEAFNLYDKDCDGKIALNEIGIVSRSLGRSPTEKQLQEYETKLRNEEIEQIDLNQFMGILKEMDENKEDIEDLRKAFKILDKDGNGVIDAAELRHAMTTIGEKMTLEEINEIISEFDTNNDGKIDFNEFVTAILKN